MDKFTKNFGSNFLNQQRNNNRGDTDDEEDDRSEIDKKIESVNNAAKESIKTAAKETAKKALLAAGKAALSAIGSALSAILAWLAPILAPVLLIIVCIFLILIPTSYAYIQFVGAYNDFNEGVLMVGTSVKNAFEDWWGNGESQRALDGKAENYQSFLIERFKYLNNQLIEKEIDGADTSDMKDLAVSWVYGKIYNDFFKPSTAEMFASALGQNPESRAPILKPLEDTVNEIYTPVLGSNVEDSRAETHGDSINLYDIAAFDYVAGTLFDLMDLDLDIALNQLIEENKKEIEKAETERKMEIYQRYGGKLIYQWGYHVDKLTNNWGVRKALGDKGIDTPSILNTKINKAKMLYDFLMEAQGYSSSSGISSLREKLAKLDNDNYSDGHSAEALGKALFTKEQDYTTISSLSNELDNMYLSYILSFATNEDDVKDLKATVKSILKNNPFKDYVTDVENKIKEELDDAYIDSVKEFTQADLEAQIEKMVTDLKLSRTQQAAIDYRNYLIELEAVTSVEYYTINLQSELFKSIGQDMPDYTASNSGASKYIVKKAKGKSAKTLNLFRNGISAIPDINNSFIVDSQENPVVAAIDVNSGTDYFEGNVNKVISAVNEKLTENITALENYKILYESLSSDGNTINKDTAEYKEALKNMEDVFWEEMEEQVDTFTSNAWFKFKHGQDISSPNGLDGKGIAEFRGDIFNRTTNSRIWNNLINGDWTWSAKTSYATAEEKTAFPIFYRDVIQKGASDKILDYGCDTFVSIRNEYDSVLDTFTINGSVINQFRSLNVSTKSSASAEELLNNIIAFINDEIKNITELQAQLLALDSVNPKDSSSNVFTKANLASFYRPGEYINGQGNNGLAKNEYSDGEFTLNIMAFKYTQEEAIKKTIQKNYKDVLKNYKSTSSSGNRGNVDLTMDVSEFISGLNLADFQIEFFEKMAPLAMADYYESGILPSVTMAQAIIESSWAGLSPHKYDYLANEANNLFGIKAYYWNGPIYPYNANGNPESPGYRQYDSWAECIEDHGKFLTVGTYLANGILEAEDCWGQIDALVAGGYCESGDYTDLLTQIINDYGLELYDVKVKGSSGIESNTSSEDGFSYHKDGSLVLWREYYTNNSTFANLDKWVAGVAESLNKPSIELVGDNKLFSTHIIDAINNIDSTLESELLTVGITAGELKNIVAATLNAGLYNPTDSDKFTLQPGFKVTVPTKKNANAIVKAIALEYIDIYKKLGSKDKGFAIYMYVVGNRDLAYLEIQNETGTFAEFVKNKLGEESESYTNINSDFVKVAQILSGDINVDAKDFYRITDIAENTSGGSSTSTISNPVDLFYQDWLDAKYTMHDMYNMMIEETNLRNQEEGINRQYDLLPSYDEVLGNVANLNQESNLEGVLTIQGPNGEYYSFDIRKDFLTNNVDETLSIPNVQYIVIHDTGDTSPLATASSIIKNMNADGAKETMHYLVGGDTVYHTIKDDIVANHINDSATSNGGTRPEISNSNSLGVQFTVNSTGNKNKTFWYTVAITKHLMEKHNITDYNNVVMHNDVTGTNDSQYMLKNDREKWNEFKDALKNSTVKFIANTGGITGEAAAYTVKLAEDFIGHPYVWGATGQLITDSFIDSLSAQFGDHANEYAALDRKYFNSTYRGFDCSGLSSYVYKNNPIKPVDIGRTTIDQVKQGTDVFDKGTTIDTSKLQSGDLLFFGDWDKPYHVAIYAGSGYYIHAPEPGKVVTSSNNMNDVVRVKRIYEIAGTGNFEFYSQHDPRWANKIYYPGETISDAGCGPTSTAMVLSGIKHNPSSLDLNGDGKLTPDEMVEFSKKKGTYVVGAGTAYSFYPAVAQAVGVNLTESSSLEEVKAALRQGKAVVASYGTGHWTSGGHLIALVGITSDGKIIVHDPNLNTYNDTRYGRYNGPNPDSNIVGPGTGFKRFFIFG